MKKYWMVDDLPEFERVNRAGAGWETELPFSNTRWVVDTDAVAQAAWYLKDLIFGPDDVTGERDDIDVFLMKVICTTFQERCADVPEGEHHEPKVPSILSTLVALHQADKKGGR